MFWKGGEANLAKELEVYDLLHPSDEMPKSSGAKISPILID